MAYNLAALKKFIPSENAPLIRSSATSTVGGAVDTIPAEDLHDPLPEGVDFSQGGWATDFATSLVALLFFVVGTSPTNAGKDDFHFMYLYAGTAIAHFGGGLAHRFFPNRAADGTGQVGFYVSMIVGYGGNCLRYGLGWGVGAIYAYIALFNAVGLIGAGTLAVLKMERTRDARDDAEGSGFAYDMLFAFFELLCAFMEIWTSVLFGMNFASNAYGIAAVVANVLGWSTIYIYGAIATLTGLHYPSEVMQRIFHYGMIVMIWAASQSAIVANFQESCE